MVGCWVEWVDGCSQKSQFSRCEEEGENMISLEFDSPVEQQWKRIVRVDQIAENMSLLALFLVSGS